MARDKLGLSSRLSQPLDELVERIEGGLLSAWTSKGARCGEQVRIPGKGHGSTVIKDGLEVDPVLFRGEHA